MTSDARTTVLDKLTEYTKTELLGGQQADDLTSTTPLLEWGVLNSLQTARLLAYLREEFGVRVPPARLNGHHFRDLESITDLVTSLRAPAN